MNRLGLAPRTNLHRRPSLRRRSNFSMMHIIAPIIVLAVIGSVAVSVVGYFQETTYSNCVVSRTENTYNASSKMMEKRVYTENCGVFTANDDLGRLHFDSADTYGSLQEGETYTFTATGFRIPIFSMFPNIVAVQ